MGRDEVGEVESNEIAKGKTRMSRNISKMLAKMRNPSLDTYRSWEKADIRDMCENIVEKRDTSDYYNLSGVDLNKGDLNFGQ